MWESAIKVVDFKITGRDVFSFFSQNRTWDTSACVRLLLSRGADPAAKARPLGGPSRKLMTPARIAESRSGGGNRELARVLWEAEGGKKFTEDDSDFLTSRTSEASRAEDKDETSKSEAEVATEVSSNAALNATGGNRSEIEEEEEEEEEDEDAMIRRVAMEAIRAKMKELNWLED